MGNDFIERVRTLFSAEGTEDVNRGYKSMADGASRYSDLHKKLQAGWETASPLVSQFGEQLFSSAKAWQAQYHEATMAEGRMRSFMTMKGVPPDAIRSVEDLTDSIMKQTGIDDEQQKQAIVNMMNFGMSAQQAADMLPYLARQSATLGTPIEGMGMAMGKAFGSGNLGALKRMGVTIDDASFAQWKAMNSQVNWNNAAQVGALRALVLTGAMKGIDQTALQLSAVQESVGGRVKVWEERERDLIETMGAGADAVLWKTGALKRMAIAYLEGHDAQAKFVGGAAAVFGWTAKTAGKLGEYAHTYNEIRRSIELVSNTAAKAKVAKEGLAAATHADVAAEKIKTGVANAEALAIDKTALAAGKAGIAKKGLASVGGLGGLGPAGARLSGATGLLGMSPGAIAGGGAGAAGIGVAIAGGIAAAGVGLVIGDQIATVFDIGGRGEWKKAEQRKKELEADIGGKIEDAAPGFAERWKKDREAYTGQQVRGLLPGETQGQHLRRRKAELEGMQGTAQRNPDGTLTINVRGGSGVTADELDEYAAME